MSQDKISTILAAFPHLGPQSNEPTEQQLRKLLELKPDQTYCFVNLLKYREVAQYPKGHELQSKVLSGRKAYELYGQIAMNHVTKRGGKLTFASAVEMQVIGDGADWDAMATMQYRNVDAFLDMVTDPDYQRGLVHRDAGLLNTQVFVTRAVINRPVGRFSFMLMKLLRALTGKKR